MNISTTINIRKDLLVRMIRKKKKLEISLNSLVDLLLKKALNWNKNSVRTFISIKYQPYNKELGFHKLHVNLDQVLYERCLDLRKLYKLSVSYILALCIKLYLELLSNDIAESYVTDNYHNSYILMSKTEKGIFSFTIFWEAIDNTLLSNLLLSDIK